MYFLSDNTSSASPEILEALIQANEGVAKAYGDDRWTKRLPAVFADRAAVGE